MDSSGSVLVTALLPSCYGDLSLLVLRLWEEAKKIYVYDDDHPSAWGCVATVDYEGQTICTVDAHREDIRNDSETSLATGQ